MSLCSIEGCERKRRTKGLCPAHYLRSLRGKPVEAPVRRKRPLSADRGPCEVSGCYRPAKGNKGICAGHLRRRDIMKLADWARPLKLYRRKGSTKDVSARVSVEVADALDRQAKAHGYDRGEWIRLILEQQVRAALIAAAEAA